MRKREGQQRQMDLALTVAVRVRDEVELVVAVFGAAALVVGVLFDRVDGLGDDGGDVLVTE